jgi:hypothetical protein
MALNMDPERRRKLLAAAQAQREWEDRYGIVDTEWAEDTSEEVRGRRPTKEQYAELERTKREIYGMDPDTGLYRD